jgi:transposase
VTEVEVMARVERRRIWTDAERASLLAELDVPGSSVPIVARRHGVAPSLLYGWRAARKAKMGVARPEPMEFMPLGVFGRAEDEGPAMIAAPAPVTPEPTKLAPSRGSSMDGRPGLIEIDLPNGARVRVDAFVNQRALHRVLAAMKDVF